MLLPRVRLSVLLAVTTVALAITLAYAQEQQQQQQQAPFEARGGTASGSDAAAAGHAGKSAADLLKLGTVSMTTGRFADAISHFDAAIELDPANYLSYYRRATAALSLGRASAALTDFDRILELNPKFAKAHLERAKLLAREGNLEEAKKSIGSYLSLKKDDAEAKELQTAINEALKNLKSLYRASEAVDKARQKGKTPATDASLARSLDDCLRYSGLVLETAPGLLEARRSRADCALAKGDVQDAMADWTRISHLSPSPTLLLRLSALSFYIYGDHESQGREAGLQHLKTCLSSDPDNKACARAHRRLRNMSKALKKATNFIEAGSWRAALSAMKGAKVGGPTLMQDVEQAIKDDCALGKNGEDSVIPAALHASALDESALLFELHELHCRAHTELGEIKKAMPYCEKVLKRDGDNKYGRIARGEQNMEADEYEEAVRDFRAAFEATGKQDAKIHAKLQKAEKKLKISKSKDYYKVLGVGKNADDKELKKAYRKKAREHHPDKGGSPEKMAEINEAFDVLKNPELRARFDAGDDPNDPTSGQGGGGPGSYGNPFAQGFGPQFFQGGGGAQFFKSSGGFPGGGQFHFQF